MDSPYFFEKDLPDSDEFIVSEETSRHISQVLRIQEGEKIIITNGKGYTLHALVISPHKKNTKVKIIKKEFSARVGPKTAIGISLIKNNKRFEWFAEKVTEIGISAITPMICKRTEKNQFKKERTISILISAMLQSQQSWLPELHESENISEVIENENYEQKFIAHCIEEEKQELKKLVQKNASKIILIGPEGDFTNEEIEAATKNNYIPVSLGETRLRTETAGIVAAVLLK